MKRIQPRLLFLITFLVFSQHKILLASANDSIMFDNLYDQAKTKHSLDTTQQLLDLASEQDQLKYLAKGYYLKGYLENENNMYYNALNSYFEAIKYYRIIEDVTRQEACLINIAIIYSKGSFYDKAIDIYQDAMLLAEEKQDTKMIAYILYHKGRAYRLAEQYELAKEAYTNSINYFMQIADDYMIREVQAELWLIAMSQENYSSAEMYIDFSNIDQMSIHEKVRLNNNLGYTMLQTDQIDSAANLFNKAINMALLDEQHDSYKYLNSMVYSNLGQVYEIQGDSVQAMNMYVKSFNLFNLKDYNSEFLALAKKLSEYFSDEREKREYYEDKIYEYAHQLSSFQKDLREANIRYQIEAANYKMESKKRYQAQMQQQNIYITLLSILVGSICLYFYLSLKKKRSLRLEARELLKDIGYIN